MSETQGERRTGVERRVGRLDDAYYAWREGDHLCPACHHTVHDAPCDEIIEVSHEVEGDEVVEWDEPCGCQHYSGGAPEQKVAPEPEGLDARDLDRLERWASEAAVDLEPHNPDATLYGILGKTIARLRAVLDGAHPMTGLPLFACVCRIRAIPSRVACDSLQAVRAEP